MLGPEKFSQPSTYLIAEEASARGIKVKKLFSSGPMAKASLMELSYRGHREIVIAQLTSQTDCIASWIQKNKQLAKYFFRRAGINVAESESFSYDDKSKILQYCQQLGYPVVIKPLKGSKGSLAFVDLNSDIKVLAALKAFKGSRYNKVIVEKFFQGIEYRLFATRDKFVAALNRVPANVIGDGIHNINQLIKIKNRDPRRGSHGARSLERLRVDEVVRLYLQKQKKALSYIPQTGEQIFLRSNSNISTGGDSIDVTDEVHPAIKKLAVKIIRAIPGSAYAGIDYLTTDIKAKPDKKNYIVIEVNDSPGLDIHHFPYAGKPRNVTAAIIDQLFPETAKAHRAYLLTHKVKIKKQKTFHQ